MSKLHDYLRLVYGAKAKRIENALDELLQDGYTNQYQANSDYWYKFVELYCIYPDGVVYDPAISPLQNLTLHLKKIKTLGCNAVHILPFLESPMVDKGFDVSNYYKVRQNLGTLTDLHKLVTEARRLDLRLFMDIVFNHVSEQHEWFKKAQQGDEKHRNFFIHATQKPHFIRKFYKDSAVWAEYLVNGEKIIVNIAFPEHTGPIPHWRQGIDGYWYYHTYYPQQLDLNWFNPEVFIEVAKILIFWVKFGFNFRLDAIPFIGKAAYKMTGADNKMAHAITAALKYVVDKINPEAVFIVETYEELDKVIEYFGSSKIVQANLSYNFHLCTSIWVSLIKQDVGYMWQKLDTLYLVPEHAEWLNFLRNHDELSLAYLSDELLMEMREAIAKYGKDFREGCGISGRTFSLLGANKERFLMAYFLLASLPGGLVIPYGDEIACQNIPLHELSAEEKKDTRNINRGSLWAEQYKEDHCHTIFKNLAMFIGHRKMLRNFLNIWPMRLTAPKELFAVRYRNSQEELLVYINLSDKPQRIVSDFALAKIVAQVNATEVIEETLYLGPYAGVWLKRY